MSTLTSSDSAHHPFRCHIVACGSTFATAQALHKHNFSCRWVQVEDRYYHLFQYAEIAIHAALSIIESIGLVAHCVCYPLCCLYSRRRTKQEPFISELSATDHRGYYLGLSEERLGQRPHTQGHSSKPSISVSEVGDSPITRRYSCSGTAVACNTPAELDEGAVRAELENYIPPSPPRSPRLGNVPTYIEMPSPTFSRHSDPPSVPFKDTQSVPQFFSHHHRTDLHFSPADTVYSQSGSPKSGLPSAFQSPQSSPEYRILYQQQTQSLAQD